MLTRDQVKQHLLREPGIREGSLSLEIVYGDGCVTNPYIHVNDTKSISGGFSQKRIPLEMEIHLTYSLGPLNIPLIEKIFGEQEDIKIHWAQQSMISTRISRKIRSLAEVDEILLSVRKYHDITNSERYIEFYKEYWDKARQSSRDLVKRLVSEE